MAEATVPLNTPSTQRETARRTVIAALAAAGTGAAFVGLPAAATAAVDPHPAWWREADALVARINAGDLDDDESDTLGAQADELHDRIAVTPARTPEGVVAQLRVALHYVSGPGRSPAEECQAQALENALGWLERAGREG